MKISARNFIATQALYSLIRADNGLHLVYDTTGLLNPHEAKLLVQNSFQLADLFLQESVKSKRIKCRKKGK